MAIQAVVASDHRLFRQAVKAILEREGISVIAEGCDGRETVKLATQLQPEIVLLDVHIALLNGIDASRKILRTSPVTKIILLVDEFAAGNVREALHAGVVGFVLKTAPACELTKAIQIVCRGIVYLDSGTNRSLSEAVAEDVPCGGNLLTLREREVLQLICEGKAVKEMAAILGISQKTVESHRQRITAKLKMTQTAELVRYAVRCGMITACASLTLNGPLLLRDLL